MNQINRSYYKNHQIHQSNLSIQHRTARISPYYTLSNKKAQMFMIFNIVDCPDLMMTPISSGKSAVTPWPATSTNTQTSLLLKWSPISSQWALFPPLLCPPRISFTLLVALLIIFKRIWSCYCIYFMKTSTLLLSLSALVSQPKRKQLCFHYSISFLLFVNNSILFLHILFIIVRLIGQQIRPFSVRLITLPFMTSKPSVRWILQKSVNAKCFGSMPVTLWAPSS